MSHLDGLLPQKMHSRWAASFQPLEVRNRGLRRESWLPRGNRATWKLCAQGRRRPLLPIDDSVEFSLTEVCAACRVSEELVVEIVAEGIVEPSGPDRAQWRFTGVALTRVQRALRLQHDFGINLAGAALALDLLEELERLRRARAKGD